MKRDPIYAADLNERMRGYLLEYRSVETANAAALRDNFRRPLLEWARELRAVLELEGRTMNHPQEEVPERPGDLRWTEIYNEPCWHNSRLTKALCVRCKARLDRKFKKCFEGAERNLF